MEFAPYKQQVEALGLGKRMPDATYLHKSALPLISEELAKFTSALATEYAPDLDWNVAKFFRRDFKVSLLSYPTFIDESYPALASSVTIDLVRRKARKTTTRSQKTLRFFTEKRRWSHPSIRPSPTSPQLHEKVNHSASMKKVLESASRNLGIA